MTSGCLSARVAAQDTRQDMQVKRQRSRTMSGTLLFTMARYRVTIMLLCALLARRETALEWAPFLHAEYFLFPHLHTESVRIQHN